MVAFQLPDSLEHERHLFYSIVFNTIRTSGTCHTNDIQGNLMILSHIFVLLPSSIYPLGYISQ